MAGGGRHRSVRRNARRPRTIGPEPSPPPTCHRSSGRRPLRSWHRAARFEGNLDVGPEALDRLDELGVRGRAVGGDPLLGRAACRREFAEYRRIKVRPHLGFRVARPSHARHHEAGEHGGDDADRAPCQSAMLSGRRTATSGPQPSRRGPPAPAEGQPVRCRSSAGRRRRQQLLLLLPLRPAPVGSCCRRPTRRRGRWPTLPQLQAPAMTHRPE